MAQITLWGMFGVLLGGKYFLWADQLALLALLEVVVIL